MMRTQADGAPGCPIAAIRPATSADLAALGDFFAGLSVQTRFLRFFAPVRPSRGMLARLGGSTGGTQVVVAVRGAAIIGHAMAADRAGPDGSLAADVGVVVADAWQDRGIGSALMRALITGAAERGVTTLTMDLLPGNRRVLAMITRHWTAASLHHGSDCLTVEVSLSGEPGSEPRAREGRVPPPGRSPGPRAAAAAGAC